MRYVERNAVRAGLVQAPEDYAWSSAIMHLLEDRDESGLLDLETWRTHWSPEDWHLSLRQAEAECEAIRNATYSGRVLGSRDFLAELESGWGGIWRREHAGDPCAIGREPPLNDHEDP